MPCCPLCPLWDARPGLPAGGPAAALALAHGTLAVRSDCLTQYLRRQATVAAEVGGIMGHVSHPTPPDYRKRDRAAAAAVAAGLAPDINATNVANALAGSRELVR